MMSQATVKNSGDRAGIIVATLCFFHCVAGPALLAFAGFNSLIRISEKFEGLFLLVSATMGVAALLPAYRKRHRRMSCLAMFAAGFLTLLIRRYLGVDAGILGAAGAATGVALIIAAHTLNLKYLKNCGCCAGNDNGAAILARPYRLLAHKPHPEMGCRR